MNEVTVKAVLFDLGGTLVKLEDAPVVFKRILSAYGVEVSLEKLAEVHRRQNEDLDNDELALMGKAYWVQWNRRLLHSAGIDENVDFLAEKIDERWLDYAGLQLYPETFQVLTMLKESHVKIGIVTNGLERDYQRILKDLNLNGFFDVVVGLDSCKKAKPSREIFDYALDKLGVNAGEAIFVGDSVSCDYEGAKRAGLKPILIVRDNCASLGYTAISSLTEVLGYVKIGLK
jgi:putative hydrolase of the HAD superfamily